MKFHFSRPLVTATLLMFVCAAPCLAQRPRGGQRGPGGPGMMRGGMMGGGMSGDAMLLGLLQVEAVQKELDMMTEQVEAIGKIRESMAEDRGDRPDFARLRDASEAEREKIVADMRKAAEERSKKITEQLEEVLFPEQLERARQIAMQQQGVGALYSPEVGEKLSLTEDQNEKLREVMRESGEKMREQMQDLFRSGDRDAIGKKMEEMRDQQFVDAKKVLTDDQRKKFEELLGKPFEMPEQVGGFGGRGGRGPGGAPGGRGRGGRGGDRGGDGGGDGGNDA